VGIPSLRAASGALRSSLAIFASRRMIEPKLTVESADLGLYFGDDAEVVALGHDFQGVFEGSQ
jgi:hypothetical protein